MFPGLISLLKRTRHSTGRTTFTWLYLLFEIFMIQFGIWLRNWLWEWFFCFNYFQAPPSNTHLGLEKLEGAWTTELQTDKLRLVSCAIALTWLYIKIEFSHFQLHFSYISTSLEETKTVNYNYLSVKELRKEKQDQTAGRGPLFIERYRNRSITVTFDKTFLSLSLFLRSLIVVGVYTVSYWDHFPEGTNLIFHF